jgi:hypothetical protein
MRGYPGATIVASTDERSRVSVSLAVTSPSGEAFCASHEWRGATTYGRAATISEAGTDCGGNPWTDDLTTPPPLPTCEARTYGFLICRMSQVLIWNVLNEPKPEGS